MNLDYIRIHLHYIQLFCVKIRVKLHGIGPLNIQTYQEYKIWFVQLTGE